MTQQDPVDQKVIDQTLDMINSNLAGSEFRSMLNDYIKGMNTFHFLNLKNYQSKRVIKKHIHAFLSNPEKIFINREPIQIDNHHHISIQASSMHYCLPKDNNGKYTHVEVGFPSFAFSAKFHKEYRLSSNIISYMPLAPLIRELAGLMHKFKLLKLGKAAPSLERPKKSKKSKAA